MASSTLLFLLLKKIDSLEGYEGKAAEKAKIVYDLAVRPSGRIHAEMPS
jgi:hypothetical protein